MLRPRLTTTGLRPSSCRIIIGRTSEATGRRGMERSRCLAMLAARRRGLGLAAWTVGFASTEVAAVSPTGHAPARADGRQPASAAK